MRRILVEVARRKKRIKHGAKHRREVLDDLGKLPLPLPNEQLLALDEALTRLEQEDPASAELVKLRFFAGFSMPQVAEAVGQPLRSLERQWTYARSWLHRELSNDIT
jgi:RNA polymerase sigma factor (TIGR02999 family)